MTSNGTTLQAGSTRGFASHVDETYVETTNKRLAEAMAAQEGAELDVHSRVVDGRTLYRLRPRDLHTSPSNNDQPAGPTIDVTYAGSENRPGSSARSLRASRSIPLLRLAATHKTGSSDLLQPQTQPRALRRAGSSPLLNMSNTVNWPAATRPALAYIPIKKSRDADVMCRLLGGDRPSNDSLRTGRAGPEGEDPTPRKASTTPSGSQETTPVRPSQSRSKGSPFGAGVRFPSTLRREESSARLDAFAQHPHHVMREVSSSDSIRTAMADDHRAQPRRPRFQDPHVFDVIQGLENKSTSEPKLLDELSRLPSFSSVSSSLSDLSRTTAQQITVAATPDDDPRFVIWGYKDAFSSSARRPLQSSTIRSPEMDLSPPTSMSGSPATTTSKRWSLRDRSSPATSIRDSISSSGDIRPSRRILMAATIERLVAELTSQISPELLTNFFLTFRSFIEPLDLLHLLTTRFDWAMRAPSSLEDDAGRRIVRVRTFVVLRHWLLNHFMDDFFPDRALRTALCDWLNQSAREPAFRDSPKDQRLIKGLKKLVRKLKEIHVAIKPEQLEAARLASEHSAMLKDDDVDLEVDYASRIPQSSPSTTSFFRHGSSIEEDDPTPKSPPFIAGSFAVPDSQNTIARSLTAAVTKISRIKRKLGNRASRVAGSESHGLSSEYERGEDGDLLRVQGGLERYLASMGLRSDSEGASSTGASEDSKPDASTVDVTARLRDIIHEVEEPTEQIASPFDMMDPRQQRDIVSDLEPTPLKSLQPVIPIFEPELDLYDSQDAYDMRPDSVRIELDDIDLSDEDEDVTEVKRTLKRLPGVTDLRLGAIPASARTGPCSFRTVSSSSLDAIRAPSYAGPERDTVLFADEETGYEGQEGMQVVAGFILDGLVDSDEDEPGDVEAALRRLEGIVDDSKQRERARKVARQMERSAAILGRKGVTGDSRESRSSDATTATTSSVASMPPPVDVTIPEVTVSEQDPTITETSKVQEAKPTTKPFSPAPLRPPVISHKPSISKLLGAMTSRPKSDRPPLVPMLKVPSPPVHRSFVLFARSEVLARQFCLIERDLLRVINWRELVDDRQRSAYAGAANVFDWEIYVKDQRRARAEEKGSDSAEAAVKTSSIEAIVARFNLTANWVSSEIVLTANLEERAVLIAKFIRLAFKCYCQSNFQTMAQIVHGLQLPAVDRLRKTWAKVPSWEMRKYRGMQTFVSPDRNFKHLRDVTSALVAEFGQMSDQDLSPRTTSSAKGSKQQTVLGCIPFFGLFLRDLAVNQGLSTFLDPTSTGSSATVDPAGELLEVCDPSAFDHLPPLPYHMPLRPLINVHKFRLQATVVQQVLALQELAIGYPYQPETTTYFRALKIRSLGSQIMQEVSKKLEP